MKSRPLSMLAGLRGAPIVDTPDEAPKSEPANTKLPGSEFAVRTDGSPKAETWPPPPTGKIFTNDRDCEQLLGVDEPGVEPAPIGAPPRAPDENAFVVRTTIVPDEELARRIMDRANDMIAARDTAPFPPPRPPNEAARIVPASVDPSSPIAREVRDMVRASISKAIIGRASPSPPCRHEVTALRFARELRKARTALAAQDVEVQRLRRALARARRNAVAVPRPPATPVQPPRPPTLADIADVLAELAPNERTLRDSRRVPDGPNHPEFPESSRKRS